MENTIRNISNEPEASELMARLNIVLKDFVSVAYQLAVLVYSRTVKVLPNIRMDGRTFIVALFSFVLGQTLKGVAPNLLAFTRTLFQRMAFLVEFAEMDPPSQAFEPGEVLHKRARVQGAGVTPESLTVSSDIRATGQTHMSSSVRLYKKDALGEYKYVGMGIRVSDEHLWCPNHVLLELTDAEFKMKGSSRSVATLVYSKANVVKESPVTEDDYVIYNVGSTAFTRTATSKAKMRRLAMDKRVYVYGCQDGTEHGTVSEGLPSQTPLNFCFEGSYSTVCGHSGAEVQQLDKGAKFLVGMHTAGITNEGRVRNMFVSVQVLDDYTKTLENAHSSSSSSGEDSAVDFRERVRAAEAAAEYQKKAKARGDHRFDDGVLESEWQEVNAEAAMRNFKANHDEFVQNYSYLKGKGWVRAGGKTKGGAMTKHNESASEVLKGLKRTTAPLRQMSSEVESSKTLSQITTSLDSSSAEKSTVQTAPSSESSDKPTPLPRASLSGLPSISAFLQEELSNGRISKTKLREAVDGLKVSTKESSAPSDSGPTPPLGGSKKGGA